MNLGAGSDYSLALNLMNDIVTGEKTFEEAREYYAKEFLDYRRESQPSTWTSFNSSQAATPSTPTRGSYRTMRWKRPRKRGNRPRFDAAGKGRATIERPVLLVSSAPIRGDRNVRCLAPGRASRARAASSQTRPLSAHTCPCVGLRRPVSATAHAPSRQLQAV